MTLEETKAEEVQSAIVEKRVAELAVYLMQWGIADPTATLVLGNVRRMLNEVYEEATR